MNWNKWFRQTHRWLSVAFTVVVIVNGVAVAQKKYTTRLGLLAVFVLGLQFFTGLYLFVLPYAAKWISGSRDSKGGLRVSLKAEVYQMTTDEFLKRMPKEQAITAVQRILRRMEESLNAPDMPAAKARLEKVLEELKRS